jgi:hypothetical protein
LVGLAEARCFHRLDDPGGFRQESGIKSEIGVIGKGRYRKFGFASMRERRGTFSRQGFFLAP